jgi:hypothetical protein
LLAVEDDDVHGDVVGDHLDDPTEFWPPVARLRSLDGVLKPGDCLLDEFVEPLDDRVQIRHHAPDPIPDVDTANRWHRRLSSRNELGAFAIARFSSAANFHRLSRDAAH